MSPEDGYLLALTCLVPAVGLVVWIMVFARSCWRCQGKGTLVDTGRRIPPEELDDHQWGLHISLGARYYEAKHKTCPRCEGTGVNRRFR